MSNGTGGRRHPARIRFAIALALGTAIFPIVASADVDMTRASLVPGDSTARVSRGFGLWADVGLGGLTAPREVRTRYSAGISAGLMAGTRRVGPLALVARFDFQDLPTGDFSYVAYNTSQGSFGYQTRSFGAGQVFTLTAGPSVALGRGFFAEATAGGGHFNAGYDNVKFVDGLTGQVVEPPGHPGWGPVASAGLGYAFQPGPKQRMFIDIRWLGFFADDMALHLVPLRIGYRFY